MNKKKWAKQRKCILYVDETESKPDLSPVLFRLLATAHNHVGPKVQYVLEAVNCANYDVTILIIEQLRRYQPNNTDKQI